VTPGTTIEARRRLLLAALAALLAPTRAGARAWPARPLRLVAAGTAGGSADIVARLLAEALAPELGKPVVVEPRPGGSGVIAVNDLLASPRDGHAAMVAVNSLASEIPHLVRVPVDMTSAIRPIAELARGGLVLVGSTALAPRTLAELVAYMKARPRQMSYASYATGSMSHLLGLQLNKAAGLDLSHVGYKGSTPALSDVMGGHVPLMFDGMPTSLPLIRAGRLRAYAVSLPARSPQLPDVPTFTELGYPQLEAVAWMGLWIAPDVPADVQAHLRAATLRVLSRPRVRERLAELGFDPGAGRTPEELARSLRADYERVGAMLRSIGFRPE
jgi:tripartite-type tricarboxylate transporter receptor subunit TctC